MNFRERAAELAHLSEATFCRALRPGTETRTFLMLLLGHLSKNRFLSQYASAYPFITTPISVKSRIA